MVATSLRFKDRLDGASNFLSYKVKATLLLKEHDLWKIVEKVVPAPTNPDQLAAHEKDIKAQRVISNVEKDHLIPHVTENTLAKEMYTTLVDLLQSDNMNRKMRKMILKNKLKDV